MNFYPRPPRGGRQPFIVQITASSLFLSTPSARRATAVHRSDHGQQPISIHALREEGDGGFGVGCRLQIISIHALREEGD